MCENKVNMQWFANFPNKAEAIEIANTDSIICRKFPLFSEYVVLLVCMNAYAKLYMYSLNLLSKQKSCKIPVLCKHMNR